MNFTVVELGSYRPCGLKMFKLSVWTSTIKLRKCCTEFVIARKKR